MKVLSFADDLLINDYPLTVEIQSEPRRFLPVFSSKKAAKKWAGNPDLVFKLERIQ